MIFLSFLLFSLTGFSWRFGTKFYFRLYNMRVKLSRNIICINIVIWSFRWRCFMQNVKSWKISLQKEFARHAVFGDILSSPKYVCLQCKLNIPLILICSQEVMTHCLSFTIVSSLSFEAIDSNTRNIEIALTVEFSNLSINRTSDICLPSNILVCLKY